MREHTQGRLYTDEAEHDATYQDIKINAGSHRIVATVWIDDAPVHDFNAEQRANARRLVACWNALLPFTTEEIEAGIDLTKEFAQHKELLEVLKELVDGPGVPDIPEAILAKISATLAKSKESLNAIPQEKS